MKFEGRKIKCERCKTGQTLDESSEVRRDLYEAGVCLSNCTACGELISFRCIGTNAGN